MIAIEDRQAGVRFEKHTDGTSRSMPFLNVHDAGPTRYIFDADKFEIVEGEPGFITIVEKAG